MPKPRDHYLFERHHPVPSPRVARRRHVFKLVSVGLAASMVMVVVVFLMTRPEPPRPTVWVDHRIDLISRLEEATAAGPFSRTSTRAAGVAPAEGPRRVAMVLPAGASVTFASLEVPESAIFRCSLAVPFGERKPARFALYHLPDVGPPRLLHARTLSPKQKGWQPAEASLNLPPGRLRLRLECREEDAGGVVFVAEPRIETKVPEATRVPPLRRAELEDDLIASFTGRAMIRTENALSPLRPDVMPIQLARLLGAEAGSHWLLASPSSEFRTRLFVPEEGFLDVEALHMPRSRVLRRGGSRPEVTFRVAINGETVWSRRTYEPDAPGIEGVLKDRIDLSQWGGRGVQVAFLTERPEPLQRETAWVGWTRLRLGRRVPKDYRPSSLERPNVLVIAVDGLRADRVGASGDDRPLTPYLDRFAAEARVYETAIAPAPWALPTLASLQTGQYPQALGMLGLGKPSRLDPEVVTLAEHLTASGFRTGAFVFDELRDGELSARGLDQGFADWIPFTDAVIPFVRLPSRPMPKVTAPELFEGFLNWADARPDDQFFAFVHCQDVTTPYSFEPEDAEREGLLQPGVSGRRRDRVQQWHRYDRLLQKKNVSCDCQRDEKGRLVLSPELEAISEKLGDLGRGAHLREYLERYYCPTGDELAALVERYDTGVLAWDRAFGRLLEELEKRRYGERTLIVVLGTHGEQLFEHGRPGSGQSVHEESVHVPLVLDGPGIEAQRIPDVVSLAGLFPTLVELLALSPPSGPLEPAWPARAGGSQQPLAFTCLGNVRPDIENLIAVRWNDWKLTRLIGETNRDALYQIEQDPQESTDVSWEASSIASRLAGELDRWWAKRADRGGRDEESADSEQ